MQLRRLQQAVPTALLTFALILFLTLAVPRLRAQDDEPAPQQQNPAALVCGSQAYLDQLPVKPPLSNDIKRQVQLVNCSDQVLLAGTNAPRAAGQPPYPAFPQEGTWVMQAFDPNNPTNYANVLTLDVPPQWYGQHVGGNTPNIWARTGCRYDPVANRAQCETGGCSGQYDCSSGDISPPPGTTIIEWTFYQPFMDNMGNTYYFDSPDISAVNGANLTVDVSPRGGDDFDPINAKDWHLFNWNYPLTVHGKDLREPTQCVPANGTGFKVTRSAIDQTIDKNNPGYPFLGYVIVDGSGNPTQPSGNFNLACLSNCGKYKFPTELGRTGCNTKTDPNCYFWTTFCAGNDNINYNMKCKTNVGNGYQCNTDADCLACNGGTDYHIACFKNAGPNQLGACELRGFFKGTVSACNGVQDPQPAAPTSTVACTNTYGSLNPLDPDGPTKFDYADQPIVGTCSSVSFNGTQAACIGEDTLHAVLHGAYTWPNDPQVYQSDAPVYRIIFSPEGRGKAIITPAQALPSCDSLPANYMPAQNRASCAGSINDQNANLAIAKVRNAPPNQWQSTGSDWPCSVGSQRDAADNGIICEWNPQPAANCRAPKTDATYVTKSACGRVDSGTTLVSGSITPSNRDPLILEVSIPKVLNNVSLPTAISGCVGSGMDAWTRIAAQTLKTNQGVIAWYKGTSNTSGACQVTVTMASSNPAELKLYDVPKFNGALETMSTLSGDCNNCGQAGVTAGMANTAFSSDLQMGALLMVNQVPAPLPYWQNWLTNNPDLFTTTCMNANTNCPRDDGSDYLPGHGAYSGNSDVGHNRVTPGAQYFHYNSNIIAGQSQFSWIGLAIYIELNP